MHHRPIVEPDGRLAGTLSQRDPLRLLGRADAEMEGMRSPISDIMTGRLAKIEASDYVATAANLFVLNRFHALPVVDGERLVGMVTTLDLIEFIDAEEVELRDRKVMK